MLQGKPQETLWSYLGLRQQNTGSDPEGWIGSSWILCQHSTSFLGLIHPPLSCTTLPHPVSPHYCPLSTPKHLHAAWQCSYLSRHPLPLQLAQRPVPVCAGLYSAIVKCFLVLSQWPLPGQHNTLNMAESLLCPNVAICAKRIPSLRGTTCMNNSLKFKWHPAYWWNKRSASSGPNLNLLGSTVY